MPDHEAVRSTSRRTALLDVAIIVGVCLAYVALESFHVPKRWSFLVVGVTLVAYFVCLARRRTDSWRDLGLRTDNLRSAAIPVALFTALAGTGLVAWAVAHGQPLVRRQVLLLLALYPAWAIVQQLVFQGLLHRRLMVVVASPTLQAVITAAAFAAVHWGSAALVVLTFAAGLAWSVLYRRSPNLWLLAASHTVLAALAYPLVLGDAPLSRI